jgi:hypothetical protein
LSREEIREETRRRDQEETWRRNRVKGSIQGIGDPRIGNLILESTVKKE